jgi:hypothetical protein
MFNEALFCMFAGSMCLIVSVGLLSLALGLVTLGPLGARDPWPWLIGDEFEDQ